MMGLLIYKYEPLWQEVSVKSLILRWPLRPLGLLLKSAVESLGQIYPNLAQSTLGWWEFKSIQMKCHALFQGKVKMYQWLLIIFSTTTEPSLLNLIKLPNQKFKANTTWLLSVVPGPQHGLDILETLTQLILKLPTSIIGWLCTISVNSARNFSDFEINAHVFAL